MNTKKAILSCLYEALKNNIYCSNAYHYIEFNNDSEDYLVIDEYSDHKEQLKVIKSRVKEITLITWYDGMNPDQTEYKKEPKKITDNMEANVIFTESKTGNSLSYQPTIKFKSIRGMKVSLKNCINRNIPTLQRFFGYCKTYKIEVIMNGKLIATTNLAA